MSDLGLPPGNFYEILDNRGKPYFFYSAPASHYTVNVTKSDDITSFLQEELNVTRKATNFFSDELTQRDDILIAVLSLFLLLVIEGIVTTILLRSARGNVSNFGFSVKQFVELVRDFRFRHALRGRTSGASRPRINYFLLAVALVFLVSTFLLEVAVLFLTDEGLRKVSNTKITLRLRQPLTPEWIGVRFHSRVSTNRACTALTLNRVDQGTTSVSTCLVSNLSNTEYLFQKEKGQKGQLKYSNYSIVSCLHKYGAEHTVSIDGLVANYSARAYFALQDDKERLMSEENKVQERSEEQVYLTHKMYFGFLYSSFLKSTKQRKLLKITHVQDLDFTHDSGERDEIEVLRFSNNEEALRVPSMCYETNVEAPNVGTDVALAYAQAVFKSSIGVAIVEPDTNDIFMGSGRALSVKADVWGETARVLNWFSLTLTLVLSLLLLLALRFVLKPVGTAEIAGVFVKGAVGANRERSPLQLARDEKKFFYVGSPAEGSSYSFGAETDAVWDRYVEEYDEKRESWG